MITPIDFRVRFSGRDRPISLLSGLVQNVSLLLEKFDTFWGTCWERFLNFTPGVCWLTLFVKTLALLRAHGSFRNKRFGGQKALNHGFSAGAILLKRRFAILELPILLPTEF